MFTAWRATNYHYFVDKPSLAAKICNYWKRVTFFRDSRSIIPISIKHPETQLSRRKQTVYNRLRIGHTYLTANQLSYLLKDEDLPYVITCNEQ